MTFHYRIFVIFIFDKIPKGMLVTIEKELGECFQRLHFLNQWVPLIKMHCRVRFLLNFDLKIRSGQVCGSYLLYLFSELLEAPRAPHGISEHKDYTLIWSSKSGRVT